MTESENYLQIEGQFGNQKIRWTSGHGSMTEQKQ